MSEGRKKVGTCRGIDSQGKTGLADTRSWTESVGGRA